MSTHSVSDDPLRISRGRAGSFPMMWQSPAGVAIDITGFTVTAILTWRQASKALIVTRGQDAAGRFVVRWTDADVADLPEGRVSELHVRILDSAGENHDAIYPVIGEIP